MLQKITQKHKQVLRVWIAAQTGHKKKTVQKVSNAYDCMQYELELRAR